MSHNLLLIFLRIEKVYTKTTYYNPNQQRKSQLPIKIQEQKSMKLECIDYNKASRRIIIQVLSIKMKSYLMREKVERETVEELTQKKMLCFCCFLLLSYQSESITRKYWLWVPLSDKDGV